MNNQTTIVGRLTAAPELRFTAAGVPLAKFTVVWNDRVKDGDQWKDGDAHFLDVSAWRALAESCAELEKGARVVVVGELRSRRWEKDGEKRTGWQVDAAEVGVLLNRFNGGGAGWSKDRNAGADPWADASNDAAPF